jgi:Xaa-Pro aminopeptidase
MHQQMTKEKKIASAQKYLKEMGADGWLLYDFHKRNLLAHQFLEIPEHEMVSRRFFYWIPAAGAPVKIVHAIEPHILDAWPGEKRIFLSWQSLHQEVKTAVSGSRRVAMEYSPRGENPYVSYVDGGTVDLVRSFGPEVVSSGPFLPHFTAVIDIRQGESHVRAATALDKIVKETWQWITGHLREEKPVSEYQIQQRIMKEFDRLHLITDHPPIVAVNAHSADPHFETPPQGSSLVRKGDFLLIDLWAKEKGERAVFGDITRVAVAGERPNAQQKQVFDAVLAAQRAGIALVQRRFAEKKKVFGFEVDDAVRKVVREAGFGDYFLHRTGHNIEIQLHGSGASLDNLEMHDARPILPGTCFSVEPGIYLPKEFGVRLESDVYVHQDGRVEVTGGQQDEIHPLL